ncbi:MAG: IGHMBP2 family helicase [Candidatus Omnitrophica bacterium]|nr:IGHMBP2 family helicase [Candidatus Omnitrophota bacterium]
MPLLPGRDRRTSYRMFCLPQENLKTPTSSENHFQHLRNLLRLEEAEEISQFKNEYLNLSLEEREKRGKALLRLKILESHYSPGGHHLLTFGFADGRKIPLYTFDAGDVLQIEREGEGFLDLPPGTVYEKSSDSITVAFDWTRPEEILAEDALYHLTPSPSKYTYRKMFDALKEVSEAKHGRLAFFRDLILGLKKPAEGDPIPLEKIPFFNSRLNAWQKEAVRKALEAPDVSLVHGPPGTGKTTALIEIIRQAISAGDFVFATAPSNTACDHLLECLVENGIAALRLGHPARIMEHLRDHTLDFKLASHPDTKRVEEMEFDLERCYLIRQRHKDRRSLGREEREDLSDRIKQLKSDIRALEHSIFERVLAEAPVMVGTLTSARDRIFEEKAFNLLVMDEATQATEPSSWIPLLRAKKVVLAGDHFQLPPTVLSKEAEAGGLGITLFERLYPLLDERFKTLLKIQYRMHEKIMNFSSQKFYGGELIADESVRRHNLADLAHVEQAPETEEVFLYLDTAGRGFEEMLEPASESRYNPEEANLVLGVLKRLLELGVKPEEIAVISPYSAQVRLLASKAQYPGLEVDSVDGFQGREKEVVILSLVRSNVEGEMGFLTDVRRMNVAMTRAKRKLVVVGDSATLSSIKFYRDFIQYSESIGAYRSSWEML